jgi:hypothetical protein
MILIEEFLSVLLTVIIGVYSNLVTPYRGKRGSALSAYNVVLQTGKK